MMTDEIENRVTDAMVAEIAEEVGSGRRGLHQMPEALSPDEAATLRRRVIAHLSGGDALHHVGEYSFDAARASTQNCENFMGVAQIPMGVAGPLKIRSSQVNEELFVPLATTEGALIASINRGCRAITRSGGAYVRVEDVGMTRAPVFRTEGLEDTERFLTWLQNNEARMRELAESTSRFLELEEVLATTMGTTVFVRFRFTTGDAMGMNMATIACDRLVQEMIEPEVGVECVALSGNYCTDKKSSAVNFQLGRGKRIWAEVVLREPEVSRVLKSNNVALAEVQYRKNLLGSIAAGAMGYNAQFANVLSALFLATGQDPAHVVEGAMGMTTFEAREDGSVYAGVYMPDVPLAAIGGGTGLGTQREALDLLGIHVDETRPGVAVRRLAEITGAIVLAGELSLMAAFTSRDLARAHERLGRSKP